MPFEPGDHVLVRLLGKGIVREVRRHGRYLVEIKGRSLLIDEQQLSARESTSRRKPPPQLGPQAASVSSPKPPAVRSLDLHGMTTDEAVAALATVLNDAILEGVLEVRVIHGRSGGRLKSAVHNALKQVTSVRAFRVDPANPGVTIVRL